MRFPREDEMYFEGEVSRWTRESGLRKFGSAKGTNEIVFDFSRSLFLLTERPTKEIVRLSQGTFLVETNGGPVIVGPSNMASFSSNRYRIAWSDGEGEDMSFNESGSWFTNRVGAFPEKTGWAHVEFFGNNWAIERRFNAEDSDSLHMVFADLKSGEALWEKVGHPVRVGTFAVLDRPPPPVPEPPTTLASKRLNLAFTPSGYL